MKGVIRALELINQSFWHVLTSEQVLLVVRLSLLINTWHQSPSLKSTNKPYLSCSVAWTEFELGKCVHNVHIMAHCWLWCVCQIHRPLLTSLSLRIYFINTTRPSFCCSTVGMSPPCFLLACLMVCKHKPIPLRCFPRLHFQVPAWATRLWWWAMCKAAFSSLTWSRDRGTVLWSKEH